MKFTVFMIAVLVSALFAGYNAHRERQQDALDAVKFYRYHECQPLGYVGGRLHPVRTHQCNNGVFIYDDMVAR
jgi:hypothetical protein